MKIIGLDLSTKSTGYCVFEDDKLIEYGCITATSTTLLKRIDKIVNELEELLTKHSDVNKIIMEEVIPSVGKNVQTWKALMYLQAIFLMLLFKKFNKVKTEFIYPSSWRSKIGIHTGKGITRDKLKAADIAFVKEKYDIDVNDDTADAIGIAYSSFVKNSFFV